MRVFFYPLLKNYVSSVFSGVLIKIIIEEIAYSFDELPIILAEEYYVGYIRRPLCPFVST